MVWLLARLRGPSLRVELVPRSPRYQPAVVGGSSSMCARHWPHNCLVLARDDIVGQSATEMERAEVSKVTKATHAPHAAPAGMARARTRAEGPPLRQTPTAPPSPRRPAPAPPPWSAPAQEAWGTLSCRPPRPSRQSYQAPPMMPRCRECHRRPASGQGQHHWAS